VTDEALKHWALNVIHEQLIPQEEKIISGLKNDDLFDRLAREIDEARQIYLKGEGIKNLKAASTLFDLVLTDCLLAEKSFISCPIW
jgi:hypothetical protein